MRVSRERERDTKLVLEVVGPPCSPSGIWRLTKVGLGTSLVSNILPRETTRFYSFDTVRKSPVQCSR